MKLLPDKCTTGAAQLQYSEFWTRYALGVCSYQCVVYFFSHAFLPVVSDQWLVIATSELASGLTLLSAVLGFRFA